MTTNGTEQPGVLNGPPDDVIALLRPVLADLRDVVATIGPDDFSRPTPCKDYDVGALRQHVLGWVRFFAAAAADPDGQTTRPAPEDFPADVGASEAADLVATSAGALEDSIRGGILSRSVQLSQASMDGPAAVGMVLGEYLVHGWDLRRALGLEWQPDEQACAVGLEFFQGMIRPEYRGGPQGYFGEEVPVPADAPVRERLLGFAGRDAGWTAS
jgi:uncharacterized protein (TIGR03086 family)